MGPQHRKDYDQIQLVQQRDIKVEHMPHRERFLAWKSEGFGGSNSSLPLPVSRLSRRQSQNLHSGAEGGCGPKDIKCEMREDPTR